MTEMRSKRTILEVSGSDRVEFLQALVTNDVEKLKGGIGYAALLTPQGKYLSDFFLVEYRDTILVDVQSDQAADLLGRLSLYKLRSDVFIEQSNIQVSTGLFDPPDGAFADPRHASLGWRKYGQQESPGVPDSAYVPLRVKYCVPQSGIELIPNASYILEAGFERLNGVDFRKGCFVGQEVTARMKHKTKLRKGLLTVKINGSAPVGTPVTSGKRRVGILYSQSQGLAIIQLRFDRVRTRQLRANDALITLEEPV